MTSSFIAFHAAERPDAIAIIDNGREITYSAFASDIRKCVDALRAFGLMPRAGWRSIVTASISAGSCTSRAKSCP